MKEKEEDQIPKIDPAEIETLMGKFEQNKLGEDKKRLIVRMLRTLLMVMASLQENKITLQRSRDLFFGRRSEKRKKSSEAEEKDEERIECHCLVHARRKFWEIAENYPVQCGYVLMQIGRFIRTRK